METNKIHNMDCIEGMKNLNENSIDAIVTDPPYGLVSIVKRFGKKDSSPAQFGKDGSFSRLAGGFMGKKWDGSGIEYNVDMWKECLRVLKPGGMLLAFSGTRTYHRMAVAIEDAGFEVRDMIEWIYSTGFPKSLNIGKAVDKMNGRFSDEINKLGNYLKEQRGDRPQKEISKLFPSKTGGLTGCVANWELGFNVPTKEQWLVLKKELNLNNDYDWLIDRIGAEREVVGKDGRTAKESMFGIGIQPEWDLTKGTSEWEGWGTALKPAHEPICMARKPLSEKTVAENCLKWGTGGINIYDSRVGTDGGTANGLNGACEIKDIGMGRFPANLIHDNSEEVRECFPNSNGSGNASRFFKSIIYEAKASKSERNKGCEGLDDKLGGSLEGGNDTRNGKDQPQLKTTKNNHPTVKPLKLIEYLIKMVSKKNAIILDPFIGSGTTAIACVKTQRQFMGFEKEKEYCEIAEARLKPFLQQTKLGENKRS